MLFMKRKTNLFYCNGNDSNFITFSNYGESMTGNFLATDWKLFPSRFLCVYIDFLDPSLYTDIDYEDRKSAVIKFMAGYYENKLSYLRDFFNKYNENVENKLLPLNYLLESLLMIQFTNYDSDNNKLVLVDSFNISKLRDTDANKFKITFIGDITEQDYNGIYADMIHVINGTDVANATLVFKSTDPQTTVEYNDLDSEQETQLSTQYLYGWTNKNGEYIGTDEYKFVNAITDSTISEDTEYYYTDSILDEIIKEEQTTTNIKFNIMLPLYDLINISTNSSEAYSTITEKPNIDLDNNSNNYIMNVPLGIWFANTTIILERTSNGYAPSWSLLLSSQFKPFPYSNKMPNEISQDDTKEAFSTFSQILIKQNRITELIERLNERLTSVENSIIDINGRLNTIGNSYYLDNMHREIIDFKTQQQTLYNNFINEVKANINNTWKGYQI